jgi:uncharacterized phage-associated protein
MLIPFNPLKIAQASVVLLKLEPACRMSRLRLLKLLYIADRESLQERARPITGDSVVAMDHGPVLSSTYDLIKGQDFAAPVWDKFVRGVGKRDVELCGEPGVGELSRYEIRKLQEISERFRAYNDWAIAEFTHQFEEWKQHQPQNGSMNRIPIEDVLVAVGREKVKDDLIERGRTDIAVDAVFRRAAREVGLRDDVQPQ